MLFNSVEFGFFLPIVFAIYWLIPKGRLRVQNAFLIGASYFFYGWWDWRFLFLIVFSSVVDFSVGLGLAKARSRGPRKALLLLSICTNLGLLGFFKYFNFFAENLATAFTFFGAPIDSPFLLNVVLPVGISFYTFQTLSYSIDVYRGKIDPSRDPFAFFAFVSFFPQLVAGPIERATNLLPQFLQPRAFDHDRAVDGLRQALWGLFKKVVIADNCAVYVDLIFSNYPSHSGSVLLIGAFLFAFQIYCDFSGYSDIAIGTARLFGFDLMRNFAFPYFSRDIAEFWRRWHISLSTWFRDYVYIPLGGSRGSREQTIRNVFVIFIVSGFWHGANWTFIVWGALNALYILPLIVTKNHRKYTRIAAEHRLLPNAREVLQIGATFLATLVAWVFFRSPSVGDAVAYLAGMFSPSLFTIPYVRPTTLFVLIFLLVATEWFQRRKEHALQLDGVGLPRPVRWSVYYGVIAMIFSFSGAQRSFIYFQF